VLIEYEINGRWHFDPFFLWLTYAPFYALVLAGRLRKLRNAPDAVASNAS
jgi:hypothetical protein